MSSNDLKDLPREKYLSRIRPFYHDDDLIKVITGVRRSGKSTIMKQIAEELQSDPGASVAYMDLDSREYLHIDSPQGLMDAIDRVLPSDGRRYLLIDEVQNVEGFERVVNAYRNDGVSVFVTGSNSYLLSGELVTKLTGRYLEFDVFPFSFSEIRDFKLFNGLEFDVDREFSEYMVKGGFPRRLSFEGDIEQEKYVSSLVGEIIAKDVLKRNRIRNRTVFERILQYLTSTPSATISSTSISDYLKSQRMDVKPSTVNRYLELMFDSKLVCRCLRYDVRGRRSMATLYKSYLVDPALHTYYPSRRRDVRLGALVENIVYTELVSRDYHVTVGKLGSGEVDFVVSKGDGMAYVQVAYSLESPETVEREVAPLLRIRDLYPKYIISMDLVDVGARGARHLNLVRDFLLGDGFRLGTERGPARCSVSARIHLNRERRGCMSGLPSSSAPTFASTP